MRQFTLPIFCLLFIVSCCHQPKEPDPTQEVEQPKIVQKKNCVNDLTPPKIYELVKPRLQYSDDPKQFVKDRDYYHFSYQTNQPRKKLPINVKQSWKGDEIMYFTNKDGKVTQLALISKQCGVDKSLNTQRAVKKQTVDLISRETEILFGESLIIKDGSFKALGPDIYKWVRTPLNHQLSGVEKVRLSRGFYKCDGISGFGFRLDFFLNMKSPTELSCDLSMSN